MSLSKTKLIGGLAAIAVAGGVFVFAQDKPDLKYSAQEKKNIEIFKKEFKDMLQYGHLELADEDMADGYIQHNPNVPGSKEGFKKFFGALNRPVEPIKPEWKTPPTLLIASGPYVILMRDTQADDPTKPGEKYTWDHFDMVRIADGKIQEHWDEAEKTAPAAGRGGAPAGGGGR